MAKPTLTRQSLGEWFALSGLLCAIVVLLLLPIGMVVVESTKGVRPGGFGRGVESLGLLAARSTWLALLPSVLTAVSCTICSGITLFSPTFRKFYRFWLLLVLFTNPVFLVFGFTVLLVDLPPTIGVVLATIYVLLPLIGLIVQSAFDEFPVHLLLTARFFGASPATVVIRHVLPTAYRSVIAAVGLGAVYALGFYLLPSFVGQGHVSTLGTAIDRVANQIGDWTAACQLAVVALGTQLALLGAIFATRRTLDLIVGEP